LGGELAQCCLGGRRGDGFGIRGCRRRWYGFGGRLKAGRKVRSVAVRQVWEAEIEDAVEFVEGDAHFETGFGGSETAAAGLLHDGKALEIEPADGIRIDSTN